MIVPRYVGVNNFYAVHVRTIRKQSGTNQPRRNTMHGGGGQIRQCFMYFTEYSRVTGVPQPPGGTQYLFSLVSHS